jgi:hypothetical protein
MKTLANVQIITKAVPESIFRPVDDYRKNSGREKV